MDYRLDTIAIAVSQHYRLLKSIVATRVGFRPLTADEALTADYLSGVIETVGGRRLADYCRTCFRNGWTTGDLRSYKIKFVLVRLRNALKGDALSELAARFDGLTSMAESLAGCQADGKRRNRQALAERAERARLRAERKSTANSPEQLLLFDPSDALSLRGSEDNGPSTGTTTLEKAKTVKTAKADKAAKRTARKPRLASKASLRRMEDEIIQAEYGPVEDAEDDGLPATRTDDALEDDDMPFIPRRTVNLALYDDIDADEGWGQRGEYDYN